MLCSGNHDLDERNAEGEKVDAGSRGRATSALLAMAKASRIGDTLFTVCPWWDGPIVKQRLVEQLATPQLQGRLPRWVWAHHAPPARPADELGRHQIFRRRRACAMDHAVPAVDRDLRPRAPVALHQGWLVVADRLGESWVFNTGLQPGRPPTYIVLDLDANKAFWLAGRRSAMDRPQRAAEAARHAHRCAAGLAHILGSDCSPSLARPSTGGRLIMLWSTSPTMARCVPCPAYCRLRSAR